MRISTVSCRFVSEAVKASGDVAEMRERFRICEVPMLLRNFFHIVVLRDAITPCRQPMQALQRNCCA